MKQIYYNDGVQPSECVHVCKTLKEAKQWIRHELKGYTMVDANHPCWDINDVLHTAKYEVYNGDPVVVGENGESTLVVPVYETGLFFTE